MKICISAESTIDLSKELLKKYNINTTPFGINFNDKLVEDKEGISKEIFDFVEKSKVLPKTSAVSPEQYENYFNELKKEYDAIIHISLSSQMSCAYNNACLMAREMENVYVIDSKNLSTGIALLAIYASSLVKKGLSAEDINKEVLAKVDDVRSSFVLDQLKYMHKGGRCNAVTLLGANLLKIKPQIVVKGGKMMVGKKYRGALNKVMEAYVGDTIAEMKNADKSIVFITHSSDMPEEEKMIEERLKAEGFEVVYNTNAGGTICSHCGPGCLGILYMENE
jgi:DegV family protein with EDD domain